MPSIPDRFSLSTDMPGTLWENSSNAMTCGELVTAEHFQGINESLLFLYGRHRRVYPPWIWTTGVAPATAGVFGRYYIEPQCAVLGFYVEAALAAANAYTLRLSSAGTLVDITFPQTSVGVRTAVQYGQMIPALTGAWTTFAMGPVGAPATAITVYSVYMWSLGVERY